MKRIVAMMICLMMVLSVGALAERGVGGGPNGGGPRGGGMGSGMTQNDEEIQEVLDQNASKFQQFTFTDEETGISFEYSLYVPEDYHASQSFPLIMFIPDSTGAGKSAAQIVQQYYGATVWVTDEEQAKHPSFVLVPAFTGTVTTDNWEADPQIDATVKLIAQLEGEYSIDEDRLYTTGQSMYTVVEYTIEDIQADLVCTVSAKADMSEFYLECNFYGDDQMTRTTWDGENYEVLEDKTGFMAGDTPAILDLAQEQNLWVAIEK